MNRQSGSQLPIPVTPRDSPCEQPLLRHCQRPKRRSREGRSSWMLPGRQRTTPQIWRPSNGHAHAHAHAHAHTPPTPQWPLPRVAFGIQDLNPALTTTYTQPRDAPLPPPPPPPATSGSDRLSRKSSSSSTLTDEPGPRDAAASPTTPPPRDARHPRSPASPARPRFFPPVHERSAGFQTRYMNMLLSTEQIPRSHNILANLFSWLLLVAFVTAPANFTSRSSAAPGDAAATTTGSDGHAIASVPLAAVGCACLGVGAVGMGWLRWAHRRNYVWLMNRIYLPLLLSSLAGLVATLVAVDVQHGWRWGAAAYAAAAFEAATLLASAAMFALVDWLLLGKLKREHARQTSSRTVVDLVKAGQRPPFAPGSVV